MMNEDLKEGIKLLNWEFTINNWLSKFHFCSENVTNNL